MLNLLDLIRIHVTVVYIYIFIHHNIIETTEQKKTAKINTKRKKNNNNGTSYANLHITFSHDRHFPTNVLQPFSRTPAHIFVSPGDAPAIIKQYVAWMERQFNACQTPRSMYLSIFSSFRVIRCISQCVSPKIAIFTTFLFPLGTPLGQSR